MSGFEGVMSCNSHVHRFKSLSRENMLCTAEFPERLIKSVVFVRRAKVRMDMCLVAKCVYRAVWEIFWSLVALSAQRLDVQLHVQLCIHSAGVADSKYFTSALWN